MERTFNNEVGELCFTVQKKEKTNGQPNRSVSSRYGCNCKNVNIEICSLHLSQEIMNNFLKGGDQTDETGV